MDVLGGTMATLTWGLEDARRELLELRAENLDLRERVARLESVIFSLAPVDGPTEGEAHATWDYGEELEGKQEPE